MDPFTLALATFGVQKLRGKSTRNALQSAALIGGGAFGLGKLGGVEAFQGKPFSGISGLFTKPETYGDRGLKTITQSETFGKQFMDPERVANVARSSPLSEAVVGGAEEGKTGIAKLLQKVKDKPLETALIASTVLPLLEGDPEAPKPPFTEQDYKDALAAQRNVLKGGFDSVTDAMPTRAEVTGSNMFYANEGGLAEMVKKFNQGGVNYLPSKIDHNENDVNNYVRAEGYVEDGAGAGDKDEDTMLAQLADGEFVSRADAVLGAGILSGADPKSFKGMRKAGADFFYNQQKQLKRIYDLVDGSKKN
jgi:hypothetical protein